MITKRFAIGLLLFALFCAAIAGTGYRAVPLPPAAAYGYALPSEPAELAKAAKREEARRKKVLAELDRRRPRGVHVVIDQTHNRLYLKKGDEFLRECICSAGSGMVLTEHGGKRTWVFDTPRGVFKIKRKVTDPVWTKPDWAFVEEGLPIPRDPSKRVERGVLGDYALPFGDGYLIHGTLYTRLLGQSTSHGCIRLGDDDLREVYRAVTVGTPIFIY